MAYTKLTHKQHMVAMDFVATARTNGISNISIATMCCVRVSLVYAMSCSLNEKIALPD